MENKIKDILIELKESDKFECKLAKNSFPKEALNTYSAFANTDGGILFLGIEEKDGDFIPVGVNDPDKIKKDMFDTLNNPTRVSKNLITNNHVYTENIDGKIIIMIEVPRAHYTEKPIYLNGNLYQSYKRNHEGDYKCSENEVKIMVRDSSDDSLDNTLVNGFSIEDLDLLTITSYKNRFTNLKPTHPFVGMSNEDLLKKLGALRVNRTTSKLEPTLGGLLVFGKMESIKEALPHFHLEYIDKSNLSDERWSERVVYDGTWGEGNLYNFFFLVINKLYASLGNPFETEKDGFTRRELGDVHIALREAFVNSIIHADFKIEEAIKIIKYSNYYEFQNPGELRISKSDFFKGEHSKPRNNIIQEIFRFINLCERAGSGVPKILSAVKKEAYKYPEIEEKDSRFIFRFWKTNILEKDSNLSLKEKSILSYILQNEKITNKEAREFLDISKHEATDTFNILLDKKYIEKFGNGKGTHYKLKFSKDDEKIKKLEYISEILETLKSNI